MFFLELPFSVWHIHFWGGHARRLKKFYRPGDIFKISGPPWIRCAVSLIRLTKSLAITWGRVTRKWPQVTPTFLYAPKIGILLVGTKFLLGSCSITVRHFLWSRCAEGYPGADILPSLLKQYITFYCRWIQRFRVEQLIPSINGGISLIDKMNVFMITGLLSRVNSMNTWTSRLR